LSKPEVQVSMGKLDLEPERIAELSVLLSEDERERAGRFYFERDRRRFTVARGLLRVELGRRMQAPPARLNFVYNAFGKPALKDSSLQFNISHSAELVLIAIADASEVGVDVEFVRPQPEMHRIAERVFSPSELALFQSTPTDAQTEMFYRLWTQKEARLKASGTGFAAPADPAWSVRSIDPEAGYVGAIAWHKL